jgi:tetratricopeptide (TPR) repeat protein
MGRRRDPRSNRRPPAVKRGRPEPAGRRPSPALVVLALAIAAWFAYSTSFAGVFVFDDKFAIVDNPNIRALWPLTRAMSAPAEMPVSARPVASLTLAINYALAPADARDVMSPGGPDAAAGTAERFFRNVWGYHFVNLALHLLAALALFGVVRRTLLSDRLRLRFGAASESLAFAAALLWLVHPLLTDAVTYVTQRTEVLLGLFYFLTLYCAIRATDPSVADARRRWWTVASVAACALGMGSKQTMVTAPFIVVLWDWLFAPDPPRRIFARWRLYAGLAGTWLILGALVAHERWPHSIGFNREGWTPWTYLLTQTGVIVHYLRLSLVPARLVIDYDGWPMAHSVLEVAPYAALLAVLGGATVFALVRRRPWGFLGAWSFALLAPSSSVLPLASEIAAERRMYVTLASVIVLMVVGTYWVWQRMVGRLVADARLRRTVGAVAAVVVVGGAALALAVSTRARNRDYWSEERILRDAVEKRPDNPRARLNYGVELSLVKRFEEAERELREAVRLKDTSSPAHGNLGSVLCALGRLDEGVSHIERALALDPDYRPAYGNLAEAYGALGRREMATKYFTLAVNAEPDNPFLLSRLGWLLATSPEDGVRNGAKAVEVSERAVALRFRQDVMSLDTLAAAYAEAGRFEDATATASAAVALAHSKGDQANASAVAQRLALYRSHQRYRESQ